jgi:hypothetical protein
MALSNSKLSDPKLSAMQRRSQVTIQRGEQLMQRTKELLQESRELLKRKPIVPRATAAEDQ